MKKIISTALLIVLLFTLFTGIVQAQSGENRGTIQGHVYEDIDGDGKCINTGKEGEAPVQGVNLEFLSSDEKTTITLYSGPDGIYGLYAAGHSYWRVTAKPDASWVVTSENPLWAPLDDDNRVATGVNFCVQKAATAGKTGAAVILPESGAAQGNITTTVAFVGVLFVLSGLILEWRRRQLLQVNRRKY